ncbi:MAG: CU044_2847 family protein [Leptolyngbyaceae cyanobacterium bins.302]|nr:CU044_2847 family protein [Leptolyngbyaceae cyanobacterium bins.302]
MSTLVPVQLEDGMVLYIEAQEDTQPAAIVPNPTLETGEETRRGQKGIPSLNPPRLNPTQSMQMVQSTIRTYAYYCMTAFKDFGAANVDEVTLEFGVNLSADAGIPYIASGKAQSNLKITVKCSYPKAGEEKRASSNTTEEHGENGSGQMEEERKLRNYSDF